MRRRWWWLLLLVPLAGYALSGVVQVRPGEVAVVRRFGRVLEHKPEPGLWVGLPWGMDVVDRVAVDRVQSVTVGYREEDTSELAMPAGQLLTGDHNLVNVMVTLSYRVRPGEAERYAVARHLVDGLVERAAEAVMAEWVGGRAVDDVLLNAKTALRQPLVAETQARLEPYGVGVEVLDAQVGLVAAPDEVKGAFDNVFRAQAAIRTAVNRAEQEAQSRVRAAESEKYRTEQATAAYVQSTELMAREDAKRFLARLREYETARAANPNYLEQLWLEERGKLLARLKENGQLGVLDEHLKRDGLDLTIIPASPRRP